MYNLCSYGKIGRGGWSLRMKLKDKWKTIMEGEKRTTEKHNIFKSRYIINMVIILRSYRRRAYGVV